MGQDMYMEWDSNGAELLHTPGGVQDIYGVMCANKLKIQSAVHEVLSSYGFRDIQTPAFEYFDIFSKERGTVASKEMFKFFDRGNNTLVLRPDMTPPIARCVAKYYKDEHMQIRLSYIGNTFVNTGKYKGKLQEVTQAGAELFNDGSSDADAEMVALTIECLLKSGLKEFQLEIGHAGFFNGLVKEAGFSERETAKLRSLIESKNFFGVEDLLDSLTVSNELKEIFLKMPEMLNNLDEAIEFVKARSKSEDVYKAVERLKKVENIVGSYGFGNYITIDLSMLSNYSYYTGVIFRAYTYGNGEAVATGGRYDSLVSQFGKDAPAIGLAIVIDQLIIALSRQKLLDTGITQGTILLYPQSLRDMAVKEAERMRRQGSIIQLVRKSSQKQEEEYKEYAKRMGAEKVIYLKAEDNIEEWNVGQHF